MIAYFIMEIKLMEESKSEKFNRLAENRMNYVLKGLRLIENLSSKNNYSYTDNEADQIIRALKDAVNDVERSFKNG
jgi:hypothetical protein